MCLAHMVHADLRNKEVRNGRKSVVINVCPYCCFSDLEIVLVIFFCTLLSFMVCFTNTSLIPVESLLVVIWYIVEQVADFAECWFN